MYVIEDLKLAFLPMPRTASKTTGRAMILAGGRAIGPHHGVRLEPHPKEEWVDWKAPGWTSFSNIRNPFDAVASWQRDVVVHRLEIASLDPGWKAAALPLDETNDDETAPFPADLVPDERLPDELSPFAPLVIYRLRAHGPTDVENALYIVPGAVPGAAEIGY